MQILIIRHAIALEPEEFSKTRQEDALRPLTKEGRKKMKQGVKGLFRLTPIDILAHSPLVRAKETAEIVAKKFPDTRAIEVPELSPGRGPEAVANWLGFLSNASVVALVGHEPSLSKFIAWLTTDDNKGYLALKKGGAVLLDCPARPGPGSAKLLWSLTPGQLRMLAKD